MPAIIGGSINFVNIAGAAIVEFGDTVFISPKTVSKTFNGGGSSNTGAYIMTNNGFSSTNSVESSLIDQPVSATS